VPASEECSRDRTADLDRDGNSWTHPGETRRYAPAVAKPTRRDRLAA
jgi:hypothetical protein